MIRDRTQRKINRFLNIAITMFIVAFVFLFIKGPPIRADAKTVQKEYRDPNDCHDYPCTDKIERIGYGDTWWEWCQNCCSWLHYDDSTSHRPFDTKKRIVLFGYKCKTKLTTTQTGYEEEEFCVWGCGTFLLSDSERWMSMYPNWHTIGGKREGEPYTHYICLGHAYPKLTIKWDDGVESVVDVNGNNIEGIKNAAFTQSADGWYQYPFGKTMTTGITLKKDYTIDYIEEGNSKWTDFDDKGNFYFTDTWTMNSDRTITIHTKEIKYDQNIYVRFQKEKGDWGGYQLAYTDSVKVNTTFTLNFNKISGWNSDIYNKPSTFTDGSAFSYVSTQNNNKYLDFSRKSITPSVLTLSQIGATTKGTEKVDAVYQQQVPDIQIPKQEYTARFYTDAEETEKITDDVVQKNKFDGYYSASSDVYVQSEFSKAAVSIMDWHKNNGFMDATAEYSKNGGTILFSTDTYGSTFYFGDKDNLFSGYLKIKTNMDDLTYIVGYQHYLSTGGYQHGPLFYPPKAFPKNKNVIVPILPDGSDIIFWNDSHNTGQVTIAPVKPYNNVKFYDSNGKGLITYPDTEDMTVYASFNNSSIALPSARKTGYKLTGWKKLGYISLDFDEYRSLKNYYGMNFEDYFANTVDYDLYTNNTPLYVSYDNLHEGEYARIYYESDKEYTPGKVVTLTEDTDYYPIWEKTQYIMSFDRGLTDDDSAQMSDKTVNKGSSFFELPKPTYKGRSYYINFDSNGGSNINPISGNLNYDEDSAWTDDEYGDEWSVGGYYPDDNEPYTITNDTYFTTIWQSESIKLPTPVREGYIFEYWYDKDGNKYYPNTSITVNPGTTMYKKTLTAKWTEKAKVYTVTYKPGSTNDFSSSMNPTIATKGSSVLIQTSKFKGRSYTITTNVDGNQTRYSGNLSFRDWSSASDNISTTRYIAGYTINNIQNNYILVANWNSKTVNIPKPSKSGYIFEGWYTDKDFKHKYIGSNDIVVNPDVTKFELNLYAHFVKTPSTEAYVKTNSGLGIESTNYPISTAFKIGSNVTVKATLKSDYQFVNWTDDKGNVKSTNINYTFTMPSTDVSLTANAKPKEYNITYNLDGGKLENGKTNPTSYNMYTEDFTLNNPVREGYVFEGWTGTGITGTSSEVIITRGSKGDRTYTANWKSTTASYTVKHHYMDVNGKYSDSTGLLETETLKAQVGSSVTPKTKARTGFTTPSTQSAIVKADGTTVVDYYYARNKYSITYKKGNTDSTQTDVADNATYDSNYTMKAANTFTGRTYNVKYDKGYTTNRDWEKTTLPSNITNAHLTFKNWAIEGTTKNAEDTFKYTYAKNVTATAQWNAANIKFTSVTRTGYTFAGWKCSIDGKTYKAGDTYTINEGTSKLDVTFTATWKANTNTKYVVNHWKQNIGGNASQHNSTNYTLADTDNFTGTTDTTVRPSVKNYEGFTAPSVQTVAINGDGSTVVNYYYTRNKYTIANVDITIGNGISNVSGLGTYYYGQEVTLTANLKSGYHWHTSDNCTANKTYPTGWYATQNGYGITTFTNNTSYSSQSIKFTMPARSIKVGVKATNNTYYISFNKNRPSNALSNVNGSMNNQTFIYTDTTASANNTYTLDGWDFKGWTYENLSLANQFSVKALTDKDIKNNLSTYTVYAKWEDKVPEISIDTTNNIATTQELTLKASDSGSGVASYYFGTSNPKTTTVTYNTINPINKDYSRKETVKDAGTYYFSVQNRNGKVSTSSITFYKTTFNTNKTHITNTKGEVITDNFTSEPVKNKDFNVDYSINASGKTISPVVSRDGNEFLGWNSKPDVNSANKTITVGSNTTYYCIWKDSTKPVIRLDSLTSDTNTTEQTLVFSMFDTRNNGNKTGSDIKGYYIGTNKTNPTANEFKKVEINTNGNATVTLKINKNTFKPDTSYYIFAVDKAGNISECMARNNNKDDLKFVTINYEANGTASSPAYLADGVLKEIYIPVNTVVYPLPKAERIGYHDLLSEQWQSLNYTTSWSIKAQSDNIAKPTRMWQADKSITLYACWAANTWTVTFDYNKPSNAYYDVTNNNTKSKTVTYDSAYGSLPSPALNGWKFVGWFTEQTNGTLITKDTIVRTNNNHTLYAHWEHNNFDNGTGFTINYWTENLYRGNNQNNGYSDCKQIGKDTTDYYSNYKTVKVNKINGKSIYADETIKDILAENYLSADEKTYLKGFTLAYSVIGGGINNSKEVNTSLDNRVYHQYKDGRWIEFSSVETYNPAINTNPSVTVHIDALGKTVIDFYYKRNSYTVNPPKTDGNDGNSKDPSKATDIIPGNGIKDVDISDNATGKKNIYKYEEVVTLTANTKDGYHWHYDNDTELNKKSDDCYTRNVKHLYPSGWVDNSKNINRFYTDTNGKTSSLKDKTIKFYMPSSDVNLSVGATNNSYEVTFNKNTPNGRINDITKDVSNPTSEITGTVNSKDYIYNHKDDETVLPESIYSITGWDFIGWSRKTDVNAENADTIEWGYNKNSWNSDLSHLTTDNNVTVPLYAKYIAHTYTIKIHPNKPQQSTKDLVVTKPNEYEYNKTDNVLSKTLTYDAINYIPNSFDIFKIEGWSSLSYNYKISDTKYLIDYSDTNNKQWNLSPDDKIIIDFYTRWSENTYNVKFSEQGGTKVSGLVTIMSNNNNAIVDMDNPIIKYNVKDTTDDNYKNNTYESTYKMPNAPIRPGYNFISWNINEDVDNASDVNYLAGQAFSSIAGKIDNSETKLDNELTFYALWEKKKVATISTKSKAMGQNTIRDNAKVLDNEWYNNEISGNETILQEWNVDVDTIKKVY